MKKLIILAMVLGLATALILTKPTPQEIASAAAGKLNYAVINKNQMPHDFVAAVAAAAVVQTVADVFMGGVRSINAGIEWKTDDFVFFIYSDLTLAGTGSLKCVWLLRNGFCFYRPH